MFSDGDDNQGMVLGVVFGLIALVVGLVIGLGIYKTRMPRLVAPAGAVVLVPAAGGVGVAPPVAAAPVTGVAVEVSAIKILFEPGRAVLPAGTTQALPSVAVQAAAGRTLVVSGFVDATGEVARNEVLARERVLAVRNALTAIGVPAQKILLAMPSAIGPSASEADARRVDIRVQ